MSRKYENRLVKVRNYFGKNQIDFAQMLCINRQTYSRYETGRTPMPDEIKDKLYKLGIDLSWLITGEGEMLRQDQEIDKKIDNASSLVIKGLTTYIEETDEDVASNRKAIQELKNETTDLKNQVAYQGQQINELKAHLSLDEELEEEPEETETLQYVGFVGAAGIPQEWDTIEDTIEVPVSLLPRNRRDLFVGNVQGDSMKDIIPDGADVLLRACNSPINGRVYVFSLRGTATIKKFRLDENGPHFEYMDGSGRIIYPEKGEKWFCNAEFLGVVRNNENG